MQWLILFLPWIGGVLAAACLRTAARNHRRKRLVENLLTSKTLGVFVGLVELKGTAESETPLTSYLAALRCVHSEWTIEEEREETTTKTETDRAERGLVENYPVLAGVDAFRELARQLAETETRIALARDYYNTLTTHVNTLIRQFSDGLVALTIGARPRPLFLAKDFERAVMAIRFAR